MNQMVHCGMATSQARERLLAAAVDQAMQGGIADLSLRELAAALGTSHRMLLYHFGSREGLFVEVARAVERRQQQVLVQLFDEFDGTLVDLARRFWRQLCSP